MKRFERRPDYLFGITLAGLSVVIQLFAMHGGFRWLLFWPGLSFLRVASDYLGGTARGFGKRPEGTRSLAAFLLLFPYLLLAAVVWQLQVLLSRSAPYNLVNDSLIVARRLKGYEYPENVTLVCDLTCEFLDPAPIRTSPGYHCEPILDGNAPTPDRLVSLVRRLMLKPGERLLIHCANGSGRTGTVAAAWLVCHGQAKSTEDALRLLKAARPCIQLRRRQRDVLDEAVKLIQRCSGKNHPLFSNHPEINPRIAP